MFKHLHVKNYVLIDSLDIEFPGGLVIVTGQTGAGKSIIIGSISLVLGGKADSSIIGEAGDNCVVEAEFNVDPQESELKERLEECGAEWDDGHLILRRVVSRSGRSRAFVNDCPVNLPTLSALSSSLIDIHSQHQTMLLHDRKFQLSALDHFAGNTALLDEYSGAYNGWLTQKAELERLDAKIKKMETEREYNAARYAQLDEAGLREGELEELELEQKQLANAEEIKENLYAAEGAIAPEDGVEGRMSMDEVLRECERRMDKVSPFIPATGSLKERLGSVRIEMDDILGEIKKINGGVDVSPDRLAEVEGRLSKIYDLLHKFSCREVSELIALREELNKTLLDTTELAERRAELAAQTAASKAAAEALALQLRERRQKAAPAFASALTSSLHFLELESSVFEVELLDAPLGATGTDAVMFKFSASGKDPIDVAKCASGGEMSRIMLCLKDMMARYTNMPTMIFDEIDTGVSGSAADKMGSMICRMGDNMQVFAITHLPQVAAKGKAHYLVSKSVEADGKNITTIHNLSDDERVQELARMLSGSAITPEAIANAKSLLRY